MYRPEFTVEGRERFRGRVDKYLERAREVREREEREGAVYREIWVGEEDIEVGGGRRGMRLRDERSKRFREKLEKSMAGVTVPVRGLSVVEVGNEQLITPQKLQLLESELVQNIVGEKSGRTGDGGPNNRQAEEVQAKENFEQFSKKKVDL